MSASVRSESALAPRSTRYPLGAEFSDMLQVRVAVNGLVSSLSPYGALIAVAEAALESWAEPGAVSGLHAYTRAASTTGDASV